MSGIIEPQGVILNLGAGNSHVFGTIALDLPQWNAEHEPIPYKKESVDGIYAFHFLEHLRGEHVIEVLRECERVLKPGGVMTIVVPHRLGAMAFQDIDHKSYFTEETWKTLFDNPHYNKNREYEWKFQVNFNLICGLNERNLALFTQLIRQ